MTPRHAVVVLHEFEGHYKCLPDAQTELDKKLFVDDRYDCARVQVPVDYADPDGPRGEIVLLRVRARGEKIGSLLVDPGGPGSSGMNFVALYAGDVLGQALTSRYRAPLDKVPKHDQSSHWDILLCGL